MRRLTIVLGLLMTLNVAFAQSNFTLEAGYTSSVYSIGGVNFGASYQYIPLKIGGEVFFNYAILDDYQDAYINEAMARSSTAFPYDYRRHQIATMGLGLVYQINLNEKIKWQIVPTALYLIPVNIADHYIESYSSLDDYYMQVRQEELEGSISYGVKTGLFGKINDHVSLGITGFYFVGQELSYIRDKRVFQNGSFLSEERNVIKTPINTFQGNISLMFSF